MHSAAFIGEVAEVKEQYVADISDYRKYALLRALSAESDHKLGVCWMLTPDDGGADGKKLEYLQRPNEFRPHDPDLFDHLKVVVEHHPERTLEAIESAGLIADAEYFNEILPDDLKGREAYWAACKSKLAACDIVFFDPDNGLETSLVRGRKNSSKFIYFDEIASFFQDGKSLLIYQHFPRVQRDVFIESCRARIAKALGIDDIWAFTTKHVVFLLVVHPEQQASFGARAEAVANIFDPEFIRGYRLCSAEQAT